MLLAVLLGLAANLAPVCNALYFAEVYYVTAEYRTDTTSWVTRQWYDESIGMTRIDEGDNWQQWVYMLPSDGHPYGRVKDITPITTETHLNKKYCIAYEGSVRQYIWPLASIIPSSSWLGYVGNETIHGEIAERYYASGTEIFNNNILLATFDYNFYVTKRKLHGKMEYVPLKFEIIARDIWNGIYIQWIIYYHDYDTAPIDPKTFEVDTGLVCEQQQLADSPHVLNKLSNLPSHHSATPLSKLFHRNKQHFNEEEFKLRREIIQSNLKMIEKHNRGDHSFKLAANHLIDRTDQEIAALCGRLPTKGPRKGQPFPYSDAEVETLGAQLPEELDWRSYGAVTPVKNHRLECIGSCWAFGAIGAVEGALFLKTNRTKLVTLSEQALMDCSWGYGNEACYDGNEKEAFEYMMKHGIPNDDFYGGFKYRPTPCHADTSPVATTIEAYFKITQNETALKVALFKHGPISVAIHACLREGFFLYSGGVFDVPTCKGELNYVVTLVGYGVLDGKGYWLLKNALGEKWGASGYMLVAIEGNICNVLDEAHFVTLK